MKKIDNNKKLIYDFFIQALIKLIKADDKIELKEKVQVKAFTRREVDENYWDLFFDRYQKALEQGDDEKEFQRIVKQLNEKNVMTRAAKRRFIYSLAQIARSKSGTLDARDYEQIIAIAENIGIEDIEADSIMESVFGVTETFIAIIGTFCIGLFLYLAKSLFIPLFLAFLLSRITNRQEQLLSAIFFRKKSNVLTRLSSMLSTFLIFSLIIFIGYLATANVINELPAYEPKLIEFVDRVIVEIAQLTQLEVNDLKNMLPSLELVPVGDILRPFFSGLFDVVNFIGFLLLVFLFAGYFIFSKTRYRGIMSELDKNISSYISVKFLVSLLTGLCFYLIAVLFNLDFALFWGFLAFLLNFIPSIGSIIATIPPILFSLLLFPFQKVILIAALLIVVQNLLGNYVEPVLLGRSMRLNPITVLAGLIFWGILWGIPGMLMSAPLMALIKLVAENYSFSKKFASYL